MKKTTAKPRKKPVPKLDMAQRAARTVERLTGQPVPTNVLGKPLRQPQKRG